MELTIQDTSRPERKPITVNKVFYVGNVRWTNDPLYFSRNNKEYWIPSYYKIIEVVE